MKLFLIIYLLFICSVAFAQEKDSSIYELNISKVNPKKSVNSGQNNILKPEIFTSGFIDIINTGQVNASARFIRLFIGEPGKFSIPMSLYSGVSSNNLQNTTSTLQRSNDILVTNFINPLSGLANVSIDGVIFPKKHLLKITKQGFLYHFEKSSIFSFVK